MYSVSITELLTLEKDRDWLKRECPRRPHEITKMWHMLEQLVSLIFCSEIPYDELINVVYLFCSDLRLFSKKLYMLPTATKWWTLKGRVSAQELRSWNVQKQVRFSSFCVLVWEILANCWSRKPGVFIKIWIHGACLKTTNISWFQNLIFEHFLRTSFPYAV